MDALPPPLLRVEEPQQACILTEACRPKSPALIQIAPWLGLGGGFRGSRAVASFSLGVDATVAVLKLFEPSPTSYDYGGAFRLRLGPWVAAQTTLRRVGGEGGVSFVLRKDRFGSYGSFGLRGGVGADKRGAAYWVAAASWGVYGEEPTNEVCWGACDPVPALRGPDTFGLADGARLVVSFRRQLEHPVNEVTFGIELQPSWLWPLPESQGYRRWRRH
jgi:hypothetical protein